MEFLSQHAERAVLRFLEDLGSSRALTVTLMIRYSEWDQLSALEIDPSSYLSAESYWRDASATSILRKLPELPTSVDRKLVAEETFLDCERQCHQTNIRLNGLFEGPSDPSYPVPLHEFLSRARKIISHVLGPCPDLVQGRFGPGATFADKGKLSTIPDKMTSAPALTPDAWPFLFQWGGTLWASAQVTSGRQPEFVRGNRFSTVPKDCKKHRGIAIEPSINVFYQLGYGRVIRDRLRRRGINLNVGQDIHRRLAREASTEGHLATLDLSNASDTICKSLVKLLLPSRWFEALDMLRSKSTFFRGRWHHLEKFSSMGNGFTFELETLIFLGLVAAAIPNGGERIGRDIFAFGDDIILPTSSANDVMSMLPFFGLTVNKTKSFIDGPFRESCGGDYFLGVDVRPFFLKQSPLEPQHYISFANGIRRSAFGLARWDFFGRRAWHTILDGLPVHIRSARGPSDLGDIVIHDDERFWHTRWNRSTGIRWLQVYRPARYRKVSWSNFSPEVTLAAAVYGMPWNDGEIIPRDSVSGYRLGWVAYS